MTELHLKDYQRLFQIHSGGVHFLVADIFGRHYEKLSTLQIFSEGTWTSYLPLAVKEQCLVDGLALYSDQEGYVQYQRAFEDYRQSSIQTFTHLLQQDSLAKDEAEIFF